METKINKTDMNMWYYREEIDGDKTYDEHITNGIIRFDAKELSQSDIHELLTALNNCHLKVGVDDKKEPETESQWIIKAKQIIILDKTTAGNSWQQLATVM